MSEHRIARLSRVGHRHPRGLCCHSPDTPVDDDGQVYLSYMKVQAEQTGRESLPPRRRLVWRRDHRHRLHDRADRTTYAPPDVRRATDTDREIREGEDVSVPAAEEQLRACVRGTEAGKARIVEDLHTERLMMAAGAMPVVRCVVWRWWQGACMMLKRGESRGRRRR